MLEEGTQSGSGKQSPSPSPPAALTYEMRKANAKAIKANANAMKEARVARRIKNSVSIPIAVKPKAGASAAFTGETIAVGGADSMMRPTQFMTLFNENAPPAKGLRESSRKAALNPEAQLVSGGGFGNRVSKTRSVELFDPHKQPAVAQGGTMAGKGTFDLRSPEDSLKRRLANSSASTFLRSINISGDGGGSKRSGEPRGGGMGKRQSIFNSEASDIFVGGGRGSPHSNVGDVTEQFAYVLPMERVEDEAKRMTMVDGRESIELFDVPDPQGRGESESGLL